MRTRDCIICLTCWLRRASVNCAVRSWWWSVYEESPWHVAIETGLIFFIVWVVFFKTQYNPETKCVVALVVCPVRRAVTRHGHRHGPPPRSPLTLVRPFEHDLAVRLRRRGFGARDPEVLSEKEKQELIDEWEPIPLVPPPSHDAVALWNQRVTVTKVVSPTEVLVEGDSKPKLNMVTNDFLGLGNSEETKRVAMEAMDEVRRGALWAHCASGEVVANLARPHSHATPPHACLVRSTRSAHAGRVVSTVRPRSTST